MNRYACLESLEARIAPASIIVSSAADSGVGSLRSAIDEANATPEHDVISFKLGRKLTMEINVESALPALEGGITIEGARHEEHRFLQVILKGPADLLISGITLSGTDNVVRNLAISDFQGAGIHITGDNNRVEGSEIGVLSGYPSEGNGTGIRISGDRNLIGGFDELWKNQISGNTGAGVLIQGTSANLASGNLLQRNDILTNGTYGLDIARADGTVVEGRGAFDDQRNVIKQNPLAQIRLSGFEATDTVIQGNTLFGSFALLVEGGAHDVQVGGLGYFESNSFPNGSEIRIIDGFGVTIDGNGHFNLDIGPTGAEQNDALDADQGANGLLNRPVLSSALEEYERTRIVGSYDGAPNRQFRVLFNDLAGYRGETLVLTDSNGHADFESLIKVVRERSGPSIWARAIDLQTGDTSEQFGINVDTNSAPKVRLSDAWISEADSDVVLKFTAQLGHIYSQPVSVTLTPVGLTATPGEDFAFEPQTITFQPGQTAIIVPVIVTGDNLREGIESFRINLSNPVNGTIDAADSSGLGTIRDDDHLITISGDKKVVTWTDVDGDLVTLKSNQPIFDGRQFTFLPSLLEGSAGQLAMLDLTGLVPETPTGTLPPAYSLAFTVTAAKSETPGDGKVDVGYINAEGLRLGTVKLPGDLGGIKAGTEFPLGTSLNTLNVGSMGKRGLLTQASGAFAEEASLESVVQGKFGTFKILGDMREATLLLQAVHADQTGSVIIGGDLIGGAGDWSGSIDVIGTLKSVTIGGDVLGGSGAWSGAIHADQQLLKAKIGGDLRGGLHATEAAVGSGSMSAHGAIGSVVIAGDVSSGDSDRSGSIFTEIGTGARAFLLSASGAPTDPAPRMGSVTIGGTLSGRGLDFEGNDIFTGISSAGQLGPLKVGALEGAARDSAVQISASGKVVAVQPSDAVAIASVAVKGAVTNADVLAGYDVAGLPVNSHAQIGKVSVGGDWLASRLLAGATLENGGAEALSSAGVLDHVGVISRIAGVTIKGAVNGTTPQVSNTDLFGFAANQISAFKATGKTYQLKTNTAGVPLDQFELGTTGDTVLWEIA